MAEIAARYRPRWIALFVFAGRCAGETHYLAARYITLKQEFIIRTARKIDHPMHGKTGKPAAEGKEETDARETVYPSAAKAKHRTVLPKEQINFFLLSSEEKTGKEERSIASRYFSRKYKTVRTYT